MDFFPVIFLPDLIDKIQVTYYFSPDGIIEIGNPPESFHPGKHIVSQFVLRVIGVGNGFNYFPPEQFSLPFNNSLINFFLAVKIVIDGTFSFSHRLGYFIHRSFPEAIFAENIACRKNNLFPDIGFIG